MRKRFLLLGLLGLLAVTRAEANDACQADFDGSGVVDFADFLLFNTLYGQRGGEQCAQTVDADSLAAVTTLRDSISALQAALGATRFAVATLQSTTTELQTALASETERANENQRLLTASNDAFNSLSQTRCQESEPEPEPQPAPQPEPGPEPPVVIEPQPPAEPPPGPEPVPTLSLSFEVTVQADLEYVDIKVFVNGLSKPIGGIFVEARAYAFFSREYTVSAPPGGFEGGVGYMLDLGVWVGLPSPTELLTQRHVANIRFHRSSYRPEPIPRPIILSMNVACISLFYFEQGELIGDHVQKGIDVFPYLDNE